MLLYCDVIKEDNSNLRKKSELVNLPLSYEDLSILKEMDDYLTNSYDEEFVKTHDIRPGVGIAAPQIDVLKRMFCIQAFDEKGYFHHYCVINPKIISHSETLTYLDSGEGCLSVDRDVKGLIFRPKKIKAHCFLYDFEKEELKEVVLSLSGYLAVVFQHEYDHLDGILFVDRINKSNPFLVPENATPIIFK